MRNLLFRYLLLMLCLALSLQDESGQANADGPTRLSVDPNTIALYKFEEATPGTSFDSSASGNDAVDTGTTVVSGPWGNARFFDGVDDSINMDAARTDLVGTAALTIEFEALGDGGITPRLINHRCQGGWRIEPDGTSVRYAIKTNLSSCGWTADTFVSAPPGVDDMWHYYALTWDGATLRVYRDGVELDSQPASGQFIAEASQTLNARIGHDDFTGARYSGTIDEVRVSNISRTATAIQQTWLSLSQPPQAVPGWSPMSAIFLALLFVSVLA